ncbi:MAG: hypothetical protein ACXWE7_12010 [Nitrososphaeraceae archaeon]
MSWYKISSDLFGTKKEKKKLDPEVKARKKRDKEKIKMPKPTNIKEVKKKQKELSILTQQHLKSIVEIINEFPEKNIIQINHLAALATQKGVFSNIVEAITFIKVFLPNILNALHNKEEEENKSKSCRTKIIS